MVFCHVCRPLCAASLKKMMPNKCTVTRDGQEQKVDALELVPGDLVRLYIGDRVPADIRIIETSDLKVSSNVKTHGRTGKAQQHTCALRSSRQHSTFSMSGAVAVLQKQSGSLHTCMGSHHLRPKLCAGDAPVACRWSAPA